MMNVKRDGQWFREKDGPWPKGVSIPNEFTINYYIKKDILSKKSNYQQIDIIENDLFGRMLFLNGDIQIAEKDAHIYNKAMVAPLLAAHVALENIAILGCGDGGVLYELLQHKPKHVVLIDIDEAVISAAKEYLRSICHDAFEQENVEVVIQDATKYLEGDHVFDVIIYDLTNDAQEILGIDASTFLQQMFSKVAKCLKEKGLFSIQCCAKTDTKTLALLKEVLSKYFENITFETIFVPSFCEEWVVASAQKK